MKNRTKLLMIVLFALALAVFACANKEAPKEHGKMENSNASIKKSNDKQTYKAVGVIKNIDAADGKVTIAHEDIPGYMPAMEMTESVGDKSILSDLSPGDKVDFEIERTGSKVVITKINKIAAALSKGAEIYKTNWAECHGKNGERAKKDISLVSGHALHHLEAEHVKPKINCEDDKIPTFRNALVPKEIKPFVAYVRRNLQKNVSREPSRTI